jgi:hypothetical protein
VDQLGYEQDLTTVLCSGQSQKDSVHIQYRTDTETIAYTLWCHAHGLVSLFVRERMRMYPEEKREELAKKSFAMVVKMAESL